MTSLSQQRPLSTSHDWITMTGGEAFAARCAMSSTPTFQPQCPPLKYESGTDVATPEMRLPHYSQASIVKLEPLEDGEIKNEYGDTTSIAMVQKPRRCSSRVDNDIASQERPILSMPASAHPSQDTTPLQAHSRGLPAAVINGNDPLLGLDPQDRLDPKIWIRPRQKSCQELQLILSSQWSKNKNGQAVLPNAIRRIVHQFMIANGFVAHRTHLPKLTRKKLWRSLLLRLDMCSDNSSLVGSSELSKRLASATSKLGQYILRQSVVWQDMGIFSQDFPVSAPQFHPCTTQWVRQSWDGQISMDRASQVDALIAKMLTLNHDELLTVEEHVRLALKRHEDVAQTDLHDGSCLADSLRWGQFHAKSISNYFDSTLRLLNLFDDSQLNRELQRGTAVTPPPVSVCGRLYSPSQPPFNSSTASPERVPGARLMEEEEPLDSIEAGDNTQGATDIGIPVESSRVNLSYSAS